MSATHPARHPLARALTGTVVVLAVLLGGCGTPPWQERTATKSVSPTARTLSPTSSPLTPSATPTATLASPLNDLATGSAKRTLDAGGVRMKINYWSTLAMSDWTPAAAKPLNLSASALFIDGSEQNIFLSRVSVTTSVSGAAGALTGPAPLVDSSSVTPGYLIRSPSSYGQVFTIPTLAAGATSVTLTITYELLVQTAPKAKTYSKQTASNDLTIPIVAA